MKPLRCVVVLIGVSVIAAGVAMGGASRPVDRIQMYPYDTTPVKGNPVQIHADMYVDAARGVDASGCGLDWNHACLTIQAAIDSIPMAFDRDVTVHIAGGTYEGGILIAGRTSPNDSRVVLTGEREWTVISGPVGQENGITVIRSSNIVIENLTVEGFAEAGIRVLLSTGGQIRSVTLSGNRDGIFLGGSETLISGGIIESNLRHGVSCEGGWVTFGFDGLQETLTLADNAASGIHAGGCNASIRSSVSITGSTDGLLAVHGAEIDLNMRSDIGITTPPGGSALTADCHGMIAGFAISALECRAVRYGVCEAGSLPPGGGPPRYIYDQEN